MDNKNIDNLYESINKASKDRKIVYDLVLQHETQVNSTQNNRHQLLLMQNFLKSEILESVTCYNDFVDFLNSMYVLKSSEDRDSQEILTWLLSQKTKASDILQKLTYNAAKLEEEAEKLNSQKEMVLCHQRQLELSVKDMKVILQEMHIKLEEKENLRKDLAQKLQALKMKNSELLYSIEELSKVLNQKMKEMENCEREFNESFFAAKQSVTKEYMLKCDGIRAETLEIDKKWKSERSNTEFNMNELVKVKNSKEANLEKDMDVIKRELDQLNRDYDSNATDMQTLNQKYLEIDNLEKQLENEGTTLEIKLKLIENQITQKQINHQNKLTKLREFIAGEQNHLKEEYNQLRREHQILKKQIKPRTALSSSQVTSSSMARIQNDYVFELSSDEKDLEGDKQCGERQSE